MAKGVTEVRFNLKADIHEHDKFDAHDP